jgi:hypothetical protein
MSMVTVKFDKLCQKRKELPTIRYGYFIGQNSFKEWYNSFASSPNRHETYITEMMRFAFSGNNHKYDFYLLQNEAIKEIKDNINSFSTNFELEKYFTYVNNELDDFFPVIEIYIKDLNNVKLDFTDEQLENLTPDEKSNCILFYAFSGEIKSCLTSYVEVKSYIEQQEILFGSKNEIANGDISKTSKSDFEKIKLTEKININEITTYFENLKDAAKINTTIENIKRVLISVFEDSNGLPLKKSTLDTYFNKSKKISTRSKK